MRKLLLVILAGLAPLIADGQENKVRVRMLILAPGEKEMEVSLVAEGGEDISKPVFIGNLGMSDPVVVARKFSIAIPDAATESGFRAVAEASLPAGGSDFVMLLEPAGEKFKTHVVSSKLKGFGGGKALFLNATDLTLGATLGTEKILIPPREVVTGGPSSQRDKSWFQVTYYQPEEGGGARAFKNTRWKYRDDVRAYVFFYPNNRFNGVSSHMVVETMGRIKEEKD